METNGVTEKPRIDLVEPAGHRRAHMVFLNGRFLVLDMQLEELLAEVRAFLADEKRDLLELPVIDTIGGGKDDEQKIAVVIRNPIFLSRRALEMLQSMSHSWVRAVPGQALGDGVNVSRASAEAVAGVRDSAALARAHKVLDLRGRN